jgi:hypothetical protein
MATLDNFHTGNGRSRREYPTLADRNAWIRSGVQSSQPSQWDLTNALPVAPVQPIDPASRINSRPDANYDAGRIGSGGLNQLYVPLAPYTQRRTGDTADGVLLYDSGDAAARCPMRGLWCRIFGAGRTHTPVQTYSRFRPYTNRR